MSAVGIESIRAELLSALKERGLLIGTAVRGIYGRGPVMVDLIARLEDMVSRACRDDQGKLVFFPPVIPRETLRATGYMENMPHLAGSIHSFMGKERELPALLKTVADGEDWTPHLQPTELVLAPAVCYALYPTLAGKLPAGGALYDVTGFCFRHEPSDDPARMQSFQCRENVRLGTPDDVVQWRDVWIERGRQLLADLGLEVIVSTASDPFFGRGGRLMKANQEAQELKFEILVPIWSHDAPTAVASFNYHQDHFAHCFGIQSHDGEVAHSACLGFGMDRVAIGLFKLHGLDVNEWPDEVRQRIWP